MNAYDRACLEISLFEDFLRTPGNHQSIITAMAQACAVQIVKMNLPATSYCRSFVADAMNAVPVHNAENRKRFNSLTELDRNGSPSEEEAAEHMSRLEQELAPFAARADEIPTDGNLARIFEKIVKQKSEAAAEGFTPEAQRIMIDFISKHHLDSLAIMSAEAASFAMLNPDAGEMYSDTPARLRYENLISTMQHLIVGCVTESMDDILHRNSPLPGASMPGPELR